jgi:ribonuclease P/MRP protein subunit POP1
MPKSYPYDLVGPVTILWRPVTPPDSDDLAHSPRTVWVVCHPSIFESAFRSLTASSSFAVEASESHDKRRHKVEIVDLRGKFNIFELMGPKSSQVIKGALNPILDGESEEFNQVSPVLSFHIKIEQCPLVLGWATTFAMPRWITIWYGHWYESSRPTT